MHTTTKETKRSLREAIPSPIEPYYLSLCERRNAKSLERMTPADLQPHRDPYFHHMNMAWQLRRSPPTKIVELESYNCPSWNAFFTKLTPPMPVTCIGYGPMIPSGPTDPSVAHKRLEYALKLAAQALYEIVFVLREQAPSDDDTYRNLILMLGQFHIAEKYMAAVGETMRNSGAEDILVETGLCKLTKAFSYKVYLLLDSAKPIACTVRYSEPRKNVNNLYVGPPEDMSSSP